MCNAPRNLWDEANADRTLNWVAGATGVNFGLRFRRAQGPELAEWRIADLNRACGGGLPFL
jgi:hypothetical protein